ncbi:MAG: hypothetical protein ACK4ND_03980, partial [Cytophagaceae bacterium]
LIASGGVLFSIIGLVRDEDGKGMAIAGLICGAIGVILGLIVTLAVAAAASTAASASTWN